MSNISDMKEAFAKRRNFFRTVQVWPIREDFDCEGWIDNFSGDEERLIATKILSEFLYFPKKMLDRLFYDSVGCAISRIQGRLKISTDDFYKKNVLYSYIPGENANPSDSGYSFVKKARDVLGVPEENLRHFSDVRNEVLRVQSSPSAIVFCDDFVGSGCQCVEALSKKDSCGVTLYDQARRMGCVLAYAPLIANISGLEKIQSAFPELICTPIYKLGKEYNLFERECLCWDGDEGLFKAGCELILEKSKILGIPDNAGETVSARGFHNLGMFIAFEDSMPDCDPAIFYCSDKGWCPLMRKNYDRSGMR